MGAERPMGRRSETTEELFVSMYTMPDAIKSSMVAKKSLTIFMPIFFVVVTLFLDLTHKYFLTFIQEPEIYTNN
jgi:hypothetical protein